MILLEVPDPVVVFLAILSLLLCRDLKVLQLLELCQVYIIFR